MFFVKSMICRGGQTALRVAMPFLPYREPEIVSSCAALGGVLKKEQARSVLIVTDQGIVNGGLVAPLEAVLTENGVPYTIFSETQPNPTVENVEAALAQYHRNNCDCLIAMGGGSSMDCAKAIGARVAYPKKQLDR